MTDKPGFLTEDQALATVTRLTRARLTRFVAAEVIRPANAEGRTVYRQIDIARMELLCDLSDDLDLDDNALGVVMDLIDQLHGSRSDLSALMQALGEEAEEVRLRVVARLRR
ncbi:MAG: hypothetical protein DI533_07240 [Cereibacter sphaeroides]|uniref:Chaperone modulatory protein CbpM n=1 Tax=Cereibacter sphaeroides TaxID=1063 RepID=A0A2W5SHR5_CERSP|nr:MAG: hypothetical protein DI533_07240 [Cereibacter sphaeroides]